MKREVSFWIAVGLLLIFTLPSAAVDIIQIEYFIDEDPGFGEGIELEFDPGEEVNISELIDVSELDDGFHILYVRAAQEIAEQDEEANWSHTLAHSFYKVSFDRDNLYDVVYAEYFIDEDPGNGQASELELEAGTEAVIMDNLNIGELENGFHVLYVRAAQEDDDGEWRWTQTHLQSFLKMSVDQENLYDVVYAEYFIDEDPGMGEANELELEAGTETAVTANLNIGELENGFHVLYVRAAQEDDDGDWLWTQLHVQSFFKMSIDQENQHDIVYAEYFIDEDPGLGSANELELEAGVETVVSTNLDISELVNGFHVLYVRAAQEDDDGGWRWTQLHVQSFLKMSIDQENQHDIVYAEYFIDEDPGFANASEIELEAGVESVVTSQLDIGELESGFHVLYVRAAQEDENGDWIWSLVHVQSFYKRPHDADNLYDIVHLEYFIDEDPGMGDGVEMQIDDDTEVTLEERLDIDELDLGDHVLYVRGAQLDENDDEIFSHTYVHEFTKRDTNSAPEWTDVPEEVGSDEDQLIEFSVTGEDSEDEILTITAVSEDLPEGWEFADNDSGSGEFSWRPTFDDSGEYMLTLTLFDGEHEDIAEVQITVNEVNHSPDVREPIGDEIVTEEDAGRLDIADLDEVFFDPDDDNVLNFDFMMADGEQVPEFLNMAIDDDNVLFVEPDENANLGDVSIEVEVIADDGIGERAVAIFRMSAISERVINSNNVRAGPVRLMRRAGAPKVGILNSRNSKPPRRDDSVSDFFNLYVTPVNDPPTIVVDPEEQEIREGEEAEIRVVADDVDFDWEGDELQISVEAPDEHC